MLPKPSTGSGETWNLGFETPQGLGLSGVGLEVTLTC